MRVSTRGSAISASGGAVRVLRLWAKPCEERSGDASRGAIPGVAAQPAQQLNTIPPLAQTRGCQYQYIDTKVQDLHAHSQPPCSTSSTPMSRSDSLCHLDKCCVCSDRRSLYLCKLC